MWSRVYLHLNMWSEAGRLATPHNSHAHARDLVSFPENKCGPSSLGLPELDLMGAGRRPCRQHSLLWAHSSHFDYCIWPPSQTKWVCAVGEVVKLCMRRRVYLQIMTSLLLLYFQALCSVLVLCFAQAGTSLAFYCITTWYWEGVNGSEINLWLDLVWYPSSVSQLLMTILLIMSAGWFIQISTTKYYFVN